MNNRIINTDGLYGHPMFFEVLEEMARLHDKKGRDYGIGKDTLGNVRASEHWGIPGWVGTMVRLNDKIIRLQNAAKGSALANEGVEDSLIDIACYAVVALVLFREAHDGSRDS